MPSMPATNTAARMASAITTMTPASALVAAASIGVRMIHAAPEATMEVPPATYVPLLTALGVGLLFVALLIKAVLVLAIGLLVGLFAVLRWAWRTEEDLV